jgi:hypothetical protein
MRPHLRFDSRCSLRAQNVGTLREQDVGLRSKPRHSSTPCSLLVRAAFALALAGHLQAETPAAESPDSTAPRSDFVPDPRQAGGEPDGIVQVANLVYAGTKSSQCFADHFLTKAEKESAISTSRRFHAVKLGGPEIYEYPFLIMTGEGDYRLSDAEREGLRRYIQRGGFLLASAGCSSTEWDRAFRREMATVFADQPLQPIGVEHPIFHTVYEIRELKTVHGKPRPLEGISLGGRLGIVYSPDGLNDTAHTEGCCCCGGNEIANSIEVNVNILAYALTY